MKLKQWIALMVVLVLLGNLTPVRAAGAEKANGYNVVVVMDSSQSLTEGKVSDLYGYRYEATSLFLDLLGGSDSEVAAIVFNGNNSLTDNSDQAMRRGLRLNTDLQPMNSKADREALMEQIKAVQPDGYTDIGTALLAAAEKLDGLTARNGKESVIVLFTDGMTQTKDKETYRDRDEADLPVYSQSKENGRKAVETIKKNGITLCGVYLSGKDGDPENSEVLNLVREANGFDDNAGTDQVGDLYISVSDASALTETYERFFEVISGTEAPTFEEEHVFHIPGTGVTEVNLNLLASGSSMKESEKILNQTEVTVIRQDQSVLTDRELDEKLSKGKTYAIYKLDLEPGIWTVRVNAPAGKQVQSSLLISTDVSARMTSVTETGEYVVRKPVSVTAALFRDNAALANASDYENYECVLELIRTEDQKTWSRSMEYQESSNAFTYVLAPKEVGTYYARVVFKCGETVKITSGWELWKFRNHPPKAPEVHTLPVLLSLFSQGVEELDLASLVTDLEDEAKDIVIDVDLGKYSKEAYHREGSVVTIDGVLGGSGSLFVTYTDTSGETATTEIQIEYTDRSSIQILIILLLIAVAAIVAASLSLRKRMNAKLAGNLEITVPLRDDVAVTLNVAAQECLNLSLLRVLKEHKVQLEIQAGRRGCDSSTVDTFLQTHGKQLSGVRISAWHSKKEQKDLCRITGAAGSKSVTDLADQGKMLLELEGVEIPAQVTYYRYV